MPIPEKFYDFDGYEIHLEKLCRTEPEWAANQIRRLYAELDKKAAAIKEIERREQ